MLEGATRPFDAVSQIPRVLLVRPISLRAFDADHMMLDADIAEGAQIEWLIEHLLGDPAA